MNEFYGASTIKRPRRTKTEIELLDNEIINTLRLNRPCSVRQVFYQLTNPRLPRFVEKSEKGYREIQDRCLKLRRDGKVPYSWIADLSRHAYRTNVFEDAADFIESMAWQYRADLWRNSDWICEVWVESRSIASSLLGLCDELAVSLFPCSGFSSASFVYSAAEQLNNNDLSKPLMVLFVGDYDPAGVLIDVALERELRQHLNPWIDLTFKRVGITEEMIAAYDLPTKPRKAGDRRSPQITCTVEAEALPATTLRQILRAEIESLLPPMALEIAKIAERDEQAHLQRMAALLSKGQS